VEGGAGAAVLAVVGPHPEVVEFPADLLGPAAVVVGKQREVFAGLLGLVEIVGGLKMALGHGNAPYQWVAVFTAGPSQSGRPLVELYRVSQRVSRKNGEEKGNNAKPETTITWGRSSIG